MVILTVMKGNQTVFKGSFGSRVKAIDKLNNLNAFYNGGCKGCLMTKKR